MVTSLIFFLLFFEKNIKILLTYQDADATIQTEVKESLKNRAHKEDRKMAHIKEVRVKAMIYRYINSYCNGYFWTDRVFKTFTDDAGNKTYYIDGREVSKDEGNDEYIEFKKANARYQGTQDCKDFIKREWARFYKDGKKDAEKYALHEADTFKQEVKEYEISYEEIIERLEKSIDQYVEYIDNGRQYQEACRRNQKIEAEIEKFKALIAQRG